MFFFSLKAAASADKLLIMKIESVFFLRIRAIFFFLYSILSDQLKCFFVIKSLKFHSAICWKFKNVSGRRSNECVLFSLDFFHFCSFFVRFTKALQNNRNDETDDDEDVDEEKNEKTNSKVSTQTNKNFKETTPSKSAFVSIHFFCLI